MFSAVTTTRCPVPRLKVGNEDPQAPASEDAVAGMRDAELASPREVGRRLANQYSAADARQVGIDAFVFAPGHVVTAELGCSTVGQPAAAEGLGALAATAQQADQVDPGICPRGGVERERRGVVEVRRRMGPVGRPVERRAVRAKQTEVIGVDERQVGRERVNFPCKVAGPMVEEERLITRPESVPTRKCDPVPADPGLRAATEAERKSCCFPFDLVDPDRFAGLSGRTDSSVAPSARVEHSSTARTRRRSKRRCIPGAGPPAGSSCRGACRRRARPAHGSPRAGAAATQTAPHHSRRTVHPSRRPLRGTVKQRPRRRTPRATTRKQESSAPQSEAKPGRTSSR